jgi:hypothetical protein
MLEPSSRLALIIMAPIFLLAGIGALLSTGKRIWFLWQSRRWPVANGVITRSEVREDTENGGYDPLEPYFEYSFEVEGRKFTANTWMFGFYTELLDKRQMAKELPNRFPIGLAVSVWYHPERPTLCVLERKLQRVTIVVLVIGAAFTCLAVWMLLDAFRQ